MRIGFDGSSLGSPSGGVRRYASELLSALARIDHGDQLVVFGAPVAATLPRLAERRDVGRIAPTNLGWSYVDLPRATRGERLDVFHSPAYTSPLRGVRPIALTVHDVSYERHPEWYPYRRDPLRRRFYRRCATAADLIITDSEFSRHEITVAYDIDPTRIAVVPLGVGAPFAGFNSPPSSMTDDGPYVLHVGDLHPRRNLRVLVRALARLSYSSENHAFPKLVLVGVDRGERARLEEETQHTRLRIHFAGTVDDQALAALYAGAAAFVYPSRYEGFGLPLLEAMACGAPVIAARASAIPEVVGDAGLLVDPDDEGGFAAGIDELINNAALTDRLRRAGRHRAKEYTWDRTALLTAEAYRSAVSRNPDRRT